MACSVLHTLTPDRGSPAGHAKSQSQVPIFSACHIAGAQRMLRSSSLELSNLPLPSLQSVQHYPTFLMWPNLTCPTARGNRSSLGRQQGHPSHSSQFSPASSLQLAALDSSCHSKDIIFLEMRSLRVRESRLVYCTLNDYTDHL